GHGGLGLQPPPGPCALPPRRAGPRAPAELLGWHFGWPRTAPDPDRRPAREGALTKGSSPPRRTATARKDCGRPSTALPRRAADSKGLVPAAPVRSPPRLRFHRSPRPRAARG